MEVTGYESAATGRACARILKVALIASVNIIRRAAGKCRTMTEKPARRFGLVDAMILVAATAAGLARAEP